MLSLGLSSYAYIPGGRSHGLASQLPFPRPSTSTDWKANSSFLQLGFQMQDKFPQFVALSWGLSAAIVVESQGGGDVLRGS